MEKIYVAGVLLYREKCPNCGEFDMRGDTEFVCFSCGEEYGPNLEIFESSMQGVNRIKPKKSTRENISISQGNRCYWCGREFGSTIFRKGNTVPLRETTDHIIPVSYRTDNHKRNICTSCQICNSFKSDLLFADDDHCREYVLNRWENMIKRHIIIEG